MAKECDEYRSNLENLNGEEFEIWSATNNHLAGCRECIQWMNVCEKEDYRLAEQNGFGDLFEKIFGPEQTIKENKKNEE